MKETDYKDYKYIPIINKKMVCKLPISEILYIEHKNRRTDFFTESGNVYMYQAMEEISEYLDDNFQSCGKTLILNLSKITSICDTKVEFLNGSTIFVNRSGCVRLKQIYARYLIEHKEKEE